MADLTALTKNFKGDIVQPGDADYLAAIARWTVTAERKARYVLFPKDPADVTVALKFATSNALPLAVKCGGHNPSGASSVEDGVCIDLSRYFDTARVDPVQKLAYVGGGALWRTVERAAIVHGLGTPGGTVNHTGVVGLALGGGYGWLSGRHGLVIDNIAQCTVVIPDGSIVTASPTSHPDLFWALRGGGGNFGVITEIVLKLYPQRRTVFAGPIIFPPTKLTQVVDEVDKWSLNIVEDESAMLILTRGPDRTPVVLLLMFFNGSEEEGRANFKRFYDLGPVADFATEIPFEKINEMLNDKAIPGRKTYLGGVSLRSRIAPHAREIFNHVVSLSAAHPASATHPPMEVTMAYEFNSTEKIRSVPPEATAFRSRGPQPNVLIIVTWDQDAENSDDLSHAKRFSRELTAIVESTAERSVEEHENAFYANSVSDASVMPKKVREVWGDNLGRLQKIKKQYDPNNIFNRWFAIPPAA